MPRKNQDLKFNIEGYIDFEEQNRGLERETLFFLQKNRRKISYEIESEISKKIGQPVKCKIEFEEGSILAFGVVVLKWMGAAAGAISFIDYSSRIINWTIKRVLKRNLKNSLPMSTPKIVINSYSDYNFDHSNVTVVDSRNSDNLNNLFSTRTILLAITLINIILILGGNIYNFTTVESTRDQYLEAKEKVLNLNEDLRNSVTNLQLQEIKTRSEIEEIPEKMEAKYSIQLIEKKDSILARLNKLDEEIIVLTDSMGYYTDSSKKVIQIIEKKPSVKKEKITLNNIDGSLKIILGAIILFQFLLIMILFIRKENK